MYSTHPTLAARFAGRTSHTLRSDEPLGEDQMRAAAPSIFAEGKHVSRSDRYTYIPSIGLCLMAVWGAPVRHDDDATSAVSAALAGWPSSSSRTVSPAAGTVG